MKCAIFGCLLVFCTLEIVHANLKKDLDNFYYQSVQSIGTYVTPKETEIQDLINAANKRKKNTEDCENNFNVSLNEIVTLSQNAVQRCVDIAANHNTLKNVKICFTRIFDAFKSVVQSLTNKAKACLNKL